MRATILGHASFLFENKQERLLLDPVLRTTSLTGSMVHQYPRALDRERLPRPTLILITHAHFDHFDPETLATLPHDVPIVIPPDRRMSRKLGTIGFSQIGHLDTWQSMQHGSLRLTATPSDAPVTELGLIVETDDARFWHMSDAEPSSDTAAKILSDYGPVDVVSTKFQPTDAQLNFQHNMGSSFDRRMIADWLETACACSPKLAFPYASGLCFSGDRAWLNHYAFPFSVDFIANLLGERLAGVGSATIVRPGDVITIEDRRVGVEKQASPFVRQAAAETRADWEPFDDRLLPGLASDGERRALEAELEQYLCEGEFADWVAKQSEGNARLKAFREWRVLCQIVVHMGLNERWYAQIDFTGRKPEVRRGQTAAASYFMHIGADAAHRLIAGEVSPLEVMLEGSVRIYERLITVRDGRLQAPATARLYEEFPDPLLTFGGARKRGAKPEASAA
jgi:L-ascorbate metabolism protein UlaG (beta-lactamase superfamily)